MVSGVNDNNNSIRNFALGTAGIAAGWEGQTLLGKYLKKPIIHYVKSNFKDIQGGGYKPFVEKAVKQNNLENKLKVLDIN